MNEQRNINIDGLADGVITPLVNANNKTYENYKVFISESGQLYNNSLRTHLAQYGGIVDEIHSLHVSEDKQCVSLLQELSSIFKDLSRMNDKDRRANIADGHNFNVFDLLETCGIDIGETNHSRILKFLLEPNEMHGQGSLFLKLFLKRLGISISESFDKEHWTVHREDGNIDLLLTRTKPLAVVIIENKSNWAVDQPNQLYRYWYYAIYSRTQETCRLFYEQKKAYFRMVYLAPNEGKVPSAQTKERPAYLPKELPQTLPMDVDVRTFNDFICKWFEDCIKALPQTNHAMREFLRQYQIKCKTL